MFPDQGSGSEKSNSSAWGDSATRLLGEKIIRLADVGNLLPRNHNGKRISLATIYRWIGEGVRGAKLEMVKVPWGTATTEEAVYRFIAELNHGRNPRRNLTPLNRRKLMITVDAEARRRLGLGRKGGGAQ